MKTLLIATLGLLATSVYAQPGPGIRNEVGLPPPTVRADTPRESGPSTPSAPTRDSYFNSLPNVYVPAKTEMPHAATPSMPEPAIQRQEPQFIGGPQSAVDGSLLNDRVNKLPTPTTVGATGVSTPMPPLPGNDAKGPTSVGASQSGAQARAETKSERQTKNETERMAAAIVASELVILYNTIPSVGVPPPAVRAEIPREAIPLPANDTKAPTGVGVDIDYNDMVMRLVPHI
ncbi:hypothetical protein [Polynucleobacter sp. 80A-SIGWE]|uniref:hypothetical protein n=1 Tax=Polynucleobacter sp. 80A-SIGWE TaxID=2689100 RepID=UPI001C0C80E3|nr:hypothetical protein [Polynucleobacter sp. 80A-SIGWE]MBU3590004.1 hypothetical protein [Polynucleobacter sp. 80A-SIGWE]